MSVDATPIRVLLVDDDADPDELEGTRVADVVAPEDRATVTDRLRQRLAGQSPVSRYEFDALTTDGERVPLEFTAARITYDGDPAVLAICRNVSAREARERERRQYETIVETAPDGVFIVDEDANYVGGNVPDSGLPGLAREDFEDTSVPDLVDAGVFDPEVISRYQQAVRELLAADGDDAKEKFEFRVHPDDGDTRVFECHLALRAHDEAFRGTIGVLRESPSAAAASANSNARTSA